MDDSQRRAYLLTSLIASKNENSSSDAFATSSRCSRLPRMTVQRLGSATLNGADLYYKNQEVMVR